MFHSVPAGMMCESLAEHSLEASYHAAVTLTKHLITVMSHEEYE